MSKKKLIPEIRFPEFSENWDIISVSDMCDVYRGGTFSKADMDENGSEPCIHYGELFTKYNEVIFAIHSKTNKSDGFKSKVGDILMPSSDVTPDGLAKASAIMLGNVVLGGDMNILRPKKSFVSIFLSYLLNHSKKEIIKLVSGTTVKHIYPSQIITCQLPIVNNKSEQQKIASCLSSLDEVIEAHSQKLDLLKAHKKGLMQNLFPQEGEKVPKYRFAEFKNDGSWIKEAVGDVYDFKVTNSFAREYLNYEVGSVKNIHYGDIHTKFNTLFDITKENVPYINPDVTIEKIRKESYCNVGDIIFADASEDMNDVGKSIEIVNLNKEKLVSGLHTLLARQKKKKLAIGFGGYLFKSDWVRKQIQREAQGAKVLGISATRISNVQIIYPENQKEQQKIASCLSSIDELITAQAEKIEQLKLHKKGLMQGMFPKIIER
ncbi:MAG: restriction endonuclease subunit S [Flavobacterium sp.]